MHRNHFLWILQPGMGSIFRKPGFQPSTGTLPCMPLSGTSRSWLYLLYPTHYNTLCLSTQPYTLKHNMNKPVYSTLHTTECTLYSTLHITTQYARLLNPTRYNTEFLSSQTYVQHTVPNFSTLHISHCAHLLNPTHCVCLLNTTLFPSSQPYTQHTVPIFSTLNTTHYAHLLNLQTHCARLFNSTHCICLLNPTHLHATTQCALYATLHTTT